MKLVSGWVLTYAEFNPNGEGDLTKLGIPSSGEAELEPYRFRLSNMTSYNRSESGNTTVNVENFRITIVDKFEDFDKFFIEHLNSNN